MVNFYYNQHFLAISKKGLKDDFNSLHEPQDFTDFSHKQRNLQ